MHLYYETAELYYRIVKTNLLHEKENSAIAVDFFFKSKKKNKLKNKKGKMKTKEWKKEKERNEERKEKINKQIVNNCN